MRRLNRRLIKIGQLIGLYGTYEKKELIKIVQEDVKKGRLAKFKIKDYLNMWKRELSMTASLAGNRREWGRI